MNTKYHDTPWHDIPMQGLFVPFVCVGSGDPVRVLRLYTTNTLDTLWSIYCWDICTTCRYRIYVLCAQVLRLWDFLLLIRTLLKYLAECTPTLYCVMAYICAFVDASRTVFWDRSPRHFIICYFKTCHFKTSHSMIWNFVAYNFMKWHFMIWQDMLSYKMGRCDKTRRVITTFFEIIWSDIKRYHYISQHKVS